MSRVLVFCAWGKSAFFFSGEAALLIIMSHELSSLQAGSSVVDYSRGLEFDKCTEKIRRKENIA